MDSTRERPLIVVGIDGSAASEAALRWALGEAARRGADVEAITARPREAAFAVPAGSPPLVHRHPVSDLHALVRRAATLVPGARSATEVVLVGDPAEELTRVSRHADLLVLGSHGHGGAAGLLLGSVVGGCLRGSACPVVVIPPGAVG